MLIGAAVLVLHVAICWLLLGKMRVLLGPAVARREESLEIFWLPAPITPNHAAEEAHQQNPRDSKPSIRSAPSRAPSLSQENPAPPENTAITPPIDWQAELAREAQASATVKSETRFKEFGFPKQPPPAGKAYEFAWDRNHTHRVEAGAGALAVHLNDHCTFVLTPLPLVFCMPGKRPPNGDLFEHMTDSPAGAAEAGAR